MRARGLRGTPGGSGRSPGLGRLAVGMAAVAVAAGALAGCASARSDLGTADSNCYVDVAAALQAVRHEGRLYGIRLVSPTSLGSASPLYRTACEVTSRPSQLCLVDFEGRFRATAVTDATGDRAGRYAVVEFGYPGRRLLGTVLARRSPLPFAHPGL